MVTFFVGDEGRGLAVSLFAFTVAVLTVIAAGLFAAEGGGGKGEGHMTQQAGWYRVSFTSLMALFINWVVLLLVSVCVCASVSVVHLLCLYFICIHIHIHIYSHIQTVLFIQMHNVPCTPDRLSHVALSI